MSLFSNKYDSFKLYLFSLVEIDVNNGNIRTKFRDHSNLHDPNVINEVFHRLVF